MKRISLFVFTLYFSAICLQQHTAAQPAPIGENFRQDGIASWYGYEFDGRPTASGEIFNSSQLTAAHPTLPFGTYLLVTNRQNNRQVAVKVNDRGPFVPSRIVDVSRAAAEQLDMLITGTAPVTIEKISSNHVFMQSPQQPQVIYQQPPQVVYQQQPPQVVYPQQPIIPRLPPQGQMQMLPPVAQGQMLPPIAQGPMLPPQGQAQMLPPMAQGPMAQGQMLPPQQFQTPNLIPTPPPFPPQEAPQPAAPSINVTVYTPQQSPAPNPMDLPGGPRARLSPSITPSPNKIYKLQIGSYKVAGNAVEAYVKLKAAGLDPSYERNADYFRVVLAGVRGTDIAYVTERLGTAGFREAVIREEY